MRCGVGHMTSWVGHDKMVHVCGLGKVLALVRLNWSTSTSSRYSLGVIHAASRVSCETFHVVFEISPLHSFYLHARWLCVEDRGASRAEM